MRRIEFNLGNIHAYRYEGNGPYALLICHGAGGWGGMYDAFCFPYAEQTQADIWCWDAPGFGQSGPKEQVVFDSDQHQPFIDVRRAGARNRCPGRHEFDGGHLRLRCALQGVLA